jgi:hypothetical protein
MLKFKFESLLWKTMSLLSVACLMANVIAVESLKVKKKQQHMLSKEWIFHSINSFGLFYV